MPASEDGGKNLLDHFRLANDDSAKLIEHCRTVGGELVKVIGEAIGC
jgi:hypothetical protein